MEGFTMDFMAEDFMVEVFMAVDFTEAVSTMDFTDLTVHFMLATITDQDATTPHTDQEAQEVQM